MSGSGRHPVGSVGGQWHNEQLAAATVERFSNMVFVTEETSYLSHFDGFMASKWHFISPYWVMFNSCDLDLWPSNFQKWCTLFQQVFLTDNTSHVANMDGVVAPNLYFHPISLSCDHDPCLIFESQLKKVTVQFCDYPCEHGVNIFLSLNLNSNTILDCLTVALYCLMCLIICWIITHILTQYTW